MPYLVSWLGRSAVRLCAETHSHFKPRGQEQGHPPHRGRPHRRGRSGTRHHPGSLGSGWLQFNWPGRRYVRSHLRAGASSSVADVQLGALGSTAAAIQSSIGNVAAGSLFASAQSVSMGSALPAVGYGIGALTGAGLGRLGTKIMRPVKVKL